MTCGTRGCSQMGYYADQYTARGKMYLVTQGNEHGPYCGKFLGFWFSKPIRIHTCWFAKLLLLLLCLLTNVKTEYS